MPGPSKSLTRGEPEDRPEYTSGAPPERHPRDARQSAAGLRNGPVGTNTPCSTRGPTDSLVLVMRLLALLGVGAGAVAVGLMVVVPSTADAEFNGGVRLIVSAVVTAMIGVSLTAFALWGYFRYRFAALVRAAEAIAKGDYSLSVPVHGTRPRRPPRARNQFDRRGPDRYPRPGDRRPPHGHREPPGAAGGALQRSRTCEPLRATVVRRLRRHRPLQGRQRHVRARCRRRGAARGRREDPRQPACDRHGGPLRRRGVHADPDRDGGRGRRAPHREAAHADRTHEVPRRGQPRPDRHDLDRPGRGVRPLTPGRAARA